MIQILIHTEPLFTTAFLRVIIGVIIFPYGMQKLFGCFDDLGGGVGIRESLDSFKEKKLPQVLAWMVIMGQSFGSIALIVGLGGRIAAFANFLIFLGALSFHWSHGWTMNWLGIKKGEGIEYFILILSILLTIIINGSGALSIDYWLLTKK